MSAVNTNDHPPATPQGCRLYAGDKTFVFDPPFPSGQPLAFDFEPDGRLRITIAGAVFYGRQEQ